MAKVAIKVRDVAHLNRVVRKLEKRGYKRWYRCNRKLEYTTHVIIYNDKDYQFTTHAGSNIVVSTFKEAKQYL